MDGVILKFGFKAELHCESGDIFWDILARVEQEPRLKVPGSHATPATAGAKIEPEAGRPAPAQAERAVQTVAMATADAAVGDFPVEPVNVYAGSGDPQQRVKGGKGGGRGPMRG